MDIGPGDINLIHIQDGVSDPGSVIIEINGDASKSHIYGALDVKEIRLPTSVTAHSRIWWIRIQNDLGMNGLSDFDRIDLVNVGGDLLSSLYSQGAITNAVTIDGDLLGYIVGDSAQSITVNGAGPHTGDIITRQSGAGAIDIRR